MSIRRPRVFYGWCIVLTAVVGLFFGAPVSVFSFGIFFKSIAQEFHAGRGAVSFAFTLHNVLGALWLPVLGWLVDRWGARRLIVVITTCFGLVLVSALWLGHQIWQFYFFYAAVGITVSGAGPVPWAMVIARWFNVRRGLALGLMGMGIGLGAFAVPLMAHRLIAAFGWRAAYAAFGGAVLLISVPLVAAFVRDDPAERGLRADGAPAATAAAAVAPPVQGLCWREIWHAPAFWLMIGVFVLTGASLHAGILHMPALLTDRGVTAGRAAVASSVLGLALVVGRVGSGYLLDRFFAPHLAMLFYSAAAGGMAILWSGQAGGAVLVAAFLVGLGMGAEVELMAYLVSRYFGLRAFGTAYGYAFAAFMLAGAAGTLVMGAGFDRFHSYAVPLGGFCLALLCGVALLTRLGPYRYGVEGVPPDLPLEPVPAVSGA